MPVTIRTPAGLQWVFQAFERFQVLSNEQLRTVYDRDGCSGGAVPMGFGSGRFGLFASAVRLDVSAFRPVPPRWQRNGRWRRTGQRLDGSWPDVAGGRMVQ